LPTSAATGLRATTSTTVIVPSTMSKTSAAALATTSQRIGRRVRGGRMTIRSICPVYGLRRVRIVARALNGVGVERPVDTRHDACDRRIQERPFEAKGRGDQRCGDGGERPRDHLHD
jgi:hypothetical protein